MKFTSKLFLAWTSIFLIFYITVIAIIGLFWGIRIQFWQWLLVFLIAGVLPPAVLTWLFYKRLDYMESENQEPPTFSGQKKATFVFKTRSNNHYAELLQKIDRSFIVSYSDKEARIVKFRTDSRIMSWGVGGYVKLLDANKVEAIVYPMIADSKREEKILLQTLRLLKAVLNP
ncbi:MAG: hypothetical protein ACOYEG_09135 [Petrimonas sp.]|jgi:hypothetical protein|nr:MAG: hypothetical protein BWZ00_00416 [Bacteroidetes bacterium ADurb.BinA174]